MIIQWVQKIITWQEDQFMFNDIKFVQTYVLTEVLQGSDVTRFVQM